MSLTTARKGIGAAFAALLAMMMMMLAPSALAQSPGDPSGDGIQPQFVAGNPDCGDIGFGFGFKIDGSPNGTFAFTSADGALTGGAPEDPSNSVTISNSDGTLFDWAATLGIDAVIVKGGPNADAYVYDPEDTEDTALHAPVNPNNGQYFGISHIEFCYDYEVDVSKTANPSFTRNWDWTIEKICDQTELVLSADQTFDVNCQVTVDTDGFTDSDWAVDGTITIENNTPLDATIESVDDVLNGNNPTADCGVTFPHVLAAGDTLECTYEATGLTGTESNNHVDVTTSGVVGGGEADAPIDWGSATITKEDDCVDVDDDLVGPLGTVCVEEAPATFNYTYTVGPYEECGDYQVTNTATFTTNTDGETGTDSHTVDIEVVGCNGDGGCTLTPGYWKTHSEYGPAPYDNNWEQLAEGADTPFFLSGQTYYQVLWTPPRGNAYYILAHAYIAAELNGLNGADTTDVDAELAAAKALFETYTPAQVAALKGKNGNVLRGQFISLATTLDAYNNGLIGPGHCSEDENSSSA